jgi:DNA-binding transcriptional LysR family regulator
MVRPHLPLNALRAFEASARHLSFTKAAIELCVTQAAVSHQVKSLEGQLGVTLFKRLPRGLMLTHEGETLLPTLRDAFDRIAGTLERFESGHYREVLTVGAVGTFAVGWLLPRLPDFHAQNPFIDLRLSTNNNRVDIAAEGLDYAIRFGTGAWHGLGCHVSFWKRRFPFYPFRRSPSNWKRRQICSSTLFCAPTGQTNGHNGLLRQACGHLCHCRRGSFEAGRTSEARPLIIRLVATPLSPIEGSLEARVVATTS